MTDEQKIRKAWRECPPFKVGEVLRMPEPFEPPTMLRVGTEPCEASHDLIEFRHESGTMDGRPAKRVLGKLRDTEIQVAFSYK
jgi:hypothetical protein